MSTKYFRDDTYGLVMEHDGKELIYNPRIGEFQSPRENEFIIDASPISPEEANRLRENYDHHYREIPRPTSTQPQISSAARRGTLGTRH